MIPFVPKLKFAEKLQNDKSLKHQFWEESFDEQDEWRVLDEKQ